jgi:hypothetical protein
MILVFRQSDFLRTFHGAEDGRRMRGTCAVRQSLCVADPRRYKASFAGLFIRCERLTWKLLLIVSRLSIP